MDALRFVDSARVTHGRIPTNHTAGSSKLKSYILSAESGESLVIPSSNSVLRILADPPVNDEGATLGLVRTRGTRDDHVPPHFHREAHDVWICVRGDLQLWAGDQSRILHSGDLCFVPPGHTHTYQVLSAHCEFFGLATGPSPTGDGWSSFFRQISDEAGSYKGPLFPTDDKRPFPVPKFIELLKSGIDTIPQRDYQTFPANGDGKADDTLPDSPQPYFLRADTGPRYFAAGQCLQPLVTPVQSNGLFSISYLEGSSLLPSTPLGASAILLASSHTFLQLLDGSIDLVVEGKTERLIAGEGGFVMAGDAFKLAYTSPYTRMLVFSTGARGSLEAIYTATGKLHRGVKMIEEEFEVDVEKVKAWASENGAELV